MYLIIDGDSLLYKACYSSTSKEEAILDLDRRLFEIFDKVRGIDGSSELRYYFFIEAEGNYRKNFYGPKEYKGNRKDMELPPFYDDVYEHALTTWCAIRVLEGETDDACSIIGHYLNSKGEKFVLSSTDKDAKTNHFPIYDGKVIAFPEDADLNFWAQMLAGDSTDNIPGIEGIGSTNAIKLLKDLSPEDRQCYVFRKYTTVYGNARGLEYYRWHYIMLKLLDNYVDHTLPRYEVEGQCKGEAQFFTIFHNYFE